MASTFGSLETARSGLTAAQLGLNVTGQNISNANTTGYTRQTLDAVAVSGDTGSYQLAPTTASVGQGVKIKSVYQIRDSFLDTNYRDENAQYNLYSGMETQLTNVEDYFTEISTSTSTTNKLTGLSGQLDQLISDIKSYATSPTDTTLSATVESDADLLTESIRTEASQLTTTMKNEQSELNVIVTGQGAGDTSNGETDGGINGIIDSIQQLNTQISGYEAGTGQQASDLRDERNTLLDKLSGYLDINVAEQSNGMVTVSLKNDSTPIIDSQNDANHFTGDYVSASGSTDYTYALKWKSTDASVDGTVADVQGGLVKAYLNVINGDGTGTDNPATGQCGNVGLVYMMRKLNAFAAAFQSIMNNSSGQIADVNTPTTTPTTSPALLTYSSPTAGGTNVAQLINNLMPVAQSIAVSSDWTATPSLFLSRYTGTDNSAYFAAIVKELNSDTGNVQTVTGDANALPSNTTTYSGTLSNYADSFTTDLANAVSNATSKASWSDTNLNNFNSERQSISSVSTDDEAVSIIKYQQAYSANARVITTIDQMLDKLINGTGTVGLS